MNVCVGGGGGGQVPGLQHSLVTPLTSPTYPGYKVVVVVVVGEGGRGFQDFSTSWSHGSLVFLHTQGTRGWGGGGGVNKGRREGSNSVALKHRCLTEPVLIHGHIIMSSVGWKSQ